MGCLNSIIPEVVLAFFREPVSGALILNAEAQRTAEIAEKTKTAVLAIRTRIRTWR
jgi:hypothetical protein